MTRIAMVRCVWTDVRTDYRCELYPTRPGVTGPYQRLSCGHTHCDSFVHSLYGSMNDASGNGAGKGVLEMRSLGLLMLRVVIGVIMMSHGYPKLFGGKDKAEELPDDTKEKLGEGFVEFMEQGGVEATTGMMEQMDIPNPQANAWALALAEFGGGLALVLGWKARPAAAAIAFSQLVAVNKVHAQQGLVGGYEFNASLIAGAGCIALAGPGKLSLDG